MRRLTRAGWLLVNALVCVTAHADWRGRRVGEVLEALRPQGLAFIYNSQILPPDMAVEDEPRANDGLALAKEILARHHLQLLAIAPGVYSVVAATAAVPDTLNPDARPQPASAAPAPLEEVVVQTSRYTLAADPLTAS